MGAIGEVCCFGPDSLEWTSIDGGHTAFVDWALGGGLTDHYADLHWPGWARETGARALDEGIAAYPPPFAAQGSDLATASRRPVPLSELLNFYADGARHLAEAPEGTAFRLKPTSRHWCLSHNLVGLR